jgi:hypothetical protein
MFKFKFMEKSAKSQWLNGDIDKFNYIITAAYIESCASGIQL